MKDKSMDYFYIVIIFLHCIEHQHLGGKNYLHEIMLQVIAVIEELPNISSF